MATLPSDHFHFLKRSSPRSLAPGLMEEALAKLETPQNPWEHVLALSLLPRDPLQSGHPKGMAAKNAISHALSSDSGCPGARGREGEPHSCQDGAVRHVTRQDTPPKRP